MVFMAFTITFYGFYYLSVGDQPLKVRVFYEVFIAYFVKLMLQI